MANSYIQVGKGEHKVIALHGWFGSAAGWGGFPAVLDEEHFTYAFMDYRGYGESKSVSGRYTIEEIAADALALADALGWQRFSLVGHSMGGKAIQQVLADAPQRVQKLVGVAPVPASGVPLDEQGWQLFTSAAKSPEARKGIIDFTTGNRLSAAWLDKLVRHSLEHSAEEAFAAYLNAWAKGDFSERIRGNSVPTLVIVGEHDAAITADVVRATWLQCYPNATMEVMPNSGHYPVDETPVALATSVERFLAA